MKIVNGLILVATTPRLTLLTMSTLELNLRTLPVSLIPFSRVFPCHQFSSQLTFLTERLAPTKGFQTLHQIFNRFSLCLVKFLIIFASFR